LCILCGAGMRLMRVEPAETMITGLEYRTFECSSCQDIERRLTFTRTVPAVTTSSASLTFMDLNQSTSPVSATSADNGEAARSASSDSVDQNEAALSISPASTDEGEVAPDAPSCSLQNKAASSVSPTSMDEGEIAPDAPSYSLHQTEAASSVSADPTDVPLVTDKQRSDAYRSWAELLLYCDHLHSPLCGPRILGQAVLLLPPAAWSLRV
jgi:hypothetical protein